MKAQKKIISCQNAISYTNYSDLSKTHPALEKYMGYLFHRITLIYKSNIDKLLAKQQLQGFHFAVLSVIAYSPSISQNQICSETGIDKATMVKITDHLEKLKLIKRNESTSDRRIKNLTVTKQGENTLKISSQTRIDFEKEFLSVLSKSEQDVFKNILLKLIQFKAK